MAKEDALNSSIYITNASDGLVPIDSFSRSNDGSLLKNYSGIRARYHALSTGTRVPNTQTSSDGGKGLFSSDPFAVLGERFTGLDKLFYTLIQGVIEDPDYAQLKDSKIYEKMMRDPQIFYCLTVRKAATTSLPWIVRPPLDQSDNPEALSYSKAVEQRLRRIPRFAELLDNIMSALLPGLSVNELVWQVVNNQYVIKGHYPVNKDRIRFTPSGDIRLLSPQAPVQGIAVPGYKLIAHRFSVADGSWKKPEELGYQYFGIGLADTPLYHYFYFKMMALKFLMKTLERYGMPFKIYYTGNQNAALSSKLSEIMTALQNDSVVGIPGKKGETNVDVIANKSAGNVFMQFINYVDTLITKVILGQELMTEMPAVGSYAAAQVHRSVFGFLTSWDRELLKDTLTRTLIRYDMQLNHPNAAEELYPLFDFKKTALDDASQFLSSVREVVSMGMAVSEQQVRDFTGIREPREGEKIIRIQETEPEPEPGQQSVSAKGSGSGSSSKSTADTKNVPKVSKVGKPTKTTKAKTPRVPKVRVPKIGK